MQGMMLLRARDFDLHPSSKRKAGDFALPVGRAPRDVNWNSAKGAGKGKKGREYATHDVVYGGRSGVCHRW